MVNNILNIQLPNSKIGKLSPKKYDFTCFALYLLNLIVPQKITIDKSLFSFYKEELHLSFYLLLQVYKLLFQWFSFLVKVIDTSFSKPIKYFITFLKFKLIPLSANSSLNVMQKQQSY